MNKPLATMIGQRGLAIIKRIEACRLTAYRDTGGTWTIGWGHTGKDVKPGQEITRAWADLLLEQDVRTAESAVTGAVTRPVSEGQRDALISFAYNVGAGAFWESTLLRFVNDGKWFAATAEFLKWHHDNKKPLRGLLIRRLAEAALFAEDEWPT